MARYATGIPNGDRITIRMLLDHTSGLYDCENAPAFLKKLIADPLHHWTPAQMMAFTKAHKPKMEKDAEA